MILGGNKPVQRPASNSTARKRREGVVGESSTDALRGAPSPLPEGSDETSGGVEPLARVLWEIQGYTNEPVPASAEAFRRLAAEILASGVVVVAGSLR